MFWLYVQAQPSGQRQSCGLDPQDSWSQADNLPARPLGLMDLFVREASFGPHHDLRVSRSDSRSKRLASGMSDPSKLGCSRLREKRIERDRGFDLHEHVAAALLGCFDDVSLQLLLSRF